MDDKSSGRVIYGSAPHHAGESNAEYRQRMAFQQAEALERRQQQLREQSSPLNSSAERIRIWEGLHQLELPRDPGHRLIAVIAAHTGLSTEEVLAEQKQRAQPVGPAGTADQAPTLVETRTAGETSTPGEADTQPPDGQPAVGGPTAPALLHAGVRPV